MTDIDHNALNRKVAEVIFGLVPCKASYHEPGGQCYASPEYPNLGGDVPDYSRHPDDMADVIEHFTDQDAVVTITYSPGGMVRAVISVAVVQAVGESYAVTAPDAPTAVCMAALQTKGQLFGVWFS